MLESWSGEWDQLVLGYVEWIELIGMMNRCYLQVRLEWGRIHHLYLGRLKPIRTCTSSMRLYGELELIFVVELSWQHRGWGVGCLCWIQEFLHLLVDLL